MFLAHRAQSFNCSSVGVLSVHGRRCVGMSRLSRFRKTRMIRRSNLFNLRLKTNGETRSQRFFGYNWYVFTPSIKCRLIKVDLFNFHSFLIACWVDVLYAWVIMLRTFLSAQRRFFSPHSLRRGRAMKIASLFLFSKYHLPCVGC